MAETTFASLTWVGRPPARGVLAWRGTSPRGCPVLLESLRRQVQVLRHGGRARASRLCPATRPSFAASM